MNAGVLGAERDPKSIPRGRRRVTSKGIAWSVCALVALTFGFGTLYAYWPYEERPRDTMLGPHDHLVTVLGHTLRYRSYPENLEPERPTLLMLHGFAGSSYAWRKVAPGLSKVANVVAVDIMPFGLSDKPVDFDYSYEAQTRVFQALISALKLRDPVPMGHSYGGTLAGYLAWRDPRVSRVVLVDPGILATGIPPFVRYVFPPMGRIGARMFSSPDFRRRFLSKSFVNRHLVSDDLIQNICLGTHMSGYMDGTDAFFSSFSDVNVSGLLGGIQGRALLLWGEHDKNNPASNATRMAQRMAHAEAAIIRGSGHYPHEEKPEEVVTLVSDFLARSAPHVEAPQETSHR